MVNYLFSRSAVREKVEGGGLTAELFQGGLVRCLWSRELTAELNGDTELVLAARPVDGGPPVVEKRVTHQVETEFHLAHPGGYRISLEERRRFFIQAHSPFHYVPKVVFVSENEARHHLSWEEIDWDAVRRDVELRCGLAWGEDVEVGLLVERWPGASSLPDREFIPTPFAHHALVLGHLVRLSLCVMPRDRRSEDPARDVVKTIFTLEMGQQPLIRELAALELHAPDQRPRFLLEREIWEEDSIQLRAWWELSPEQWRRVEAEILAPNGLSWRDAEVCIRLFRHRDGRIEAVEGAGGPVGIAHDWLFTGLQDGCGYHAELVCRRRSDGRELSPAIMASSRASVPARPDKVVLLPIDHRRAYCYWHLQRERLGRRLRALEQHHGGPVRCFIRVFHDWAGALHHHMDRDREIDPFGADNWYLELEPDRVYRVQLVAVAGDGHLEELTPVSNPAQTARLQCGHNPVSYREVCLVGEHPTHRPLGSAMDTPAHSKGLLIIHLHAHLPYIRRRVIYGSSGRWQPLGFPEEWFHEAVRETYVPLIRVFERLREEGVDFRLSMDISPTLANMMRCPMLQEEFIRYMEAHISLARAEVDRTRREAPHYHAAAWMHLRRFEEVMECFLRYGMDLTRAFREFQDQGYLEISTCGATHAFLPLFAMYPQAVKAQVESAVQDYEECFGRRPHGIWLPECAYVPGIEAALHEAGLAYFFAETHAVLNGDAPAEFGTHAPVFVKGSDVAVFARDPETGKQVWSGEEGYPGDPDYLEFHIKGGPLKYNRITSRHGGPKEPYREEWAREKAARHAQHFMEARNFRFDYIKDRFWKKPLVVAMYDAELFGHHWYEGPEFLYFLFKKLYYNQNETELITPTGYLRRYPRNQELFITPSSWGDKGSFDKWMYGSVSWMYRHSHEAIEEMTAMARAAGEDGSGLHRRMAAQASRELLQAMNSDIPFVISNGHFVDRMKELFFTHLRRFWRLASLFWNLEEDQEGARAHLEAMERENPIFPSMDVECWR